MNISVKSAYSFDKDCKVFDDDDDDDDDMARKDPLCSGEFRCILLRRFICSTLSWRCMTVS